MKNQDSVFKSGIYLTVASLIFVASAYITNIWLGKHLGPKDYGTYSVIIALMTAVNLIQTSGLPQAAARFISSGKYNTETILRTSLRIQIISTLALTALFFVLAYPFAFLLHDASMAPFIQAASLILPFYGLYALYIGYHNGLHNFKRQALMSSMYAMAKLIAVIGLVAAIGLYGAIAGFIIAPLVALVFGARVPQKSAGPNSLYRPLLLFAVPLAGFAVLSTLQASMDLFFVKSLSAQSEAAGWYAASQNIAIIPYYALSAFATVLFPSVSRSINSGNPESTANSIRGAIRYLLLLLVPAAVLISTTSSQLLQILYSKSFIPAHGALSLLTVGIALYTLYYILASVINGAGKPKITVGISCIAVIVIGVSCRLFIPSIGLLGAALATTLGSLIAVMLAFTVIHRDFKRIVNWQSLIKILVASAAMYAVSSIFTLPSALLPLYYIILGIVYMGGLLALKEFTADDVTFIKNILPKKT